MLPLRFLLLVLSWLVLATQGLETQGLATQDLATYGLASHGSKIGSSAAAGAQTSSRTQHEDSLAGETGTTASSDTGSQARLDGVPPSPTAIVEGDEGERNLGPSPETERSPGVGTRRERSLFRVSVNILSVRVVVDPPHDRAGIVAQARAPPAPVGFSS